MNQAMNQLIPIDAQERAEIIKKLADDYQKQVVQKISTSEQYLQCGERYKDLNGAEKELDNIRKACKQPYSRLAEDVDAVFKPMIIAVQSVKGQYRTVMVARDIEIEHERIRQQEELNRKAEAARREEEAKAKALRDKEEAARREEEAARRRAEEATSAEERKIALAEAEKRRKEAEAAAARAETREQKSETIIAPVVQMAAPKIEGMSTRDNWKMAIEDQVAFINWAVHNNQLGLLEPSSSACNSLAKSIRKETQYPWGKIYNDRGLSSRA